MEWWALLALFVLLLLAFLLSGLPVAFAFFLLSLVGIWGWMGGPDNLHLLVHAIFPSVAHFSYVAVAMFIFMGAILFHSGVAKLAIDSLGVFAGGVRGSLSHLAIASGTAFSLLSGSAISSVALLGSTLIPEMRRRGYKHELAIGPILGAGGLAVIVPPSIFAIILAFLAKLSVGKVLIAALLPGILLGTLYFGYVVLRVRARPELAPKFETSQSSILDKIKAAGVLASVAALVVLVLGFIFWGITTPTEAAGVGALGAILLAGAYRALRWEAFKQSVLATLAITSMVLMIVAASAGLGRLLAFTGISRSLAALAVEAPVDPLVVILLMVLVVIFLGMLMDAISIMMITVPLFFPIVVSLDVDPIWFSVIMLVCLELSTITPPFGILLFTMKSVVPDASFGEVVRAGIPFVLLDLLLIAILFLVPGLATWLPSFV